MDKRIKRAPLPLHLKSKAAEEPFTGAVFVRYYSNKVKDKHEKQFTHTYDLIEAKDFMEATK